MEKSSAHRTHSCEICELDSELTEGEAFVCPRCGHRDRRFTTKSPQLCLAFALTAMILYVPANIFPFMTIELYGNRNSTTILGGIASLLDSRSYAIAAVVFLASVLIPFLKLAILFYLSLRAGHGDNARFKQRLYELVEAIGRWSMLDIFLLAILVAVVKLSHWTSVRAELGAGLFLLVVIFTMMASSQFDPRVLWKSGAVREAEKGVPT